MAITDTVTLQGKQVPYEIARIPLAALRLDPGNPRIEYILGHRFAGSATQEQITEALWEKDQVKALAQSILANGGVREHIIVQRAEDGFYVVREGNCRTASSIKLAQLHKGDTRFDAVPAHIFDATLTEEDIATLIADVHVAKKISWDGYTQAKQIHKLHRVHGKTYDWLTNHLRMSKSKVAEYISAYDAMTQFLSVHKDPEFIKKYSLFFELARKKGLKARYDADEDGFRAKWFEWVAKGRLHDPRHVRHLESILDDADAAAALDAKGYESAAAVLISKDPSLGSDVFHAVKRATEALRNTPMPDVQDLRNNDPQKVIMLRNLRRAIDDLATVTGVSL